MSIKGISVIFDFDGTLVKTNHYKKGSTQCRSLIATKESLLTAIGSLNNIENIEFYGIGKVTTTE